MTQQQTEHTGQTVSVGGFTFAAKRVTYWPGNPAQMSRLDILVESGSDADFKLAYMCQSDFLAARVRELQVTALDRTTNCAWWQGNSRGGFYSIAVVDFLPIAPVEYETEQYPLRVGHGIAAIDEQPDMIRYAKGIRTLQGEIRGPVVTTCHFTAAARCQCGSGNHMRGPGHSAWCPLLDTGAQ